jgi:small ligand-binding sensory domain FIST
MPFAAALSTAAGADRALDEVCAEVSAQLAGAVPDLALVFYSPHHEESAPQIARRLADRLKARALAGCHGEAIVGGPKEVERAPALSVWAASWGGSVGVETFHLQFTRTPDGLTLLGWPDSIAEADPERDILLIFGDPLTTPVTELLLPRLEDEHAGLAVLGGMASGMRRPGDNVLIRAGEALTDGAVGVYLRGPLPRRSVVSQGARPIGRPLVVTKCSENLIVEVGGQKPLDYMRTLYQELPEADRQLVRHGLMMGLAMSEYRDHFTRGDFLIRGIYGFDQETGAVAVADRPRLGQTVQFQLRDADTADEDLRELLRKAKTEGAPAAAGLLFSCNGRGTRLFSAPHHDAAVIQEEVGPLPLAGFFAAGELGPVGGKNFIHGFTASVVLFT